MSSIYFAHVGYTVYRCKLLLVQIGGNDIQVFPCPKV